MNRIRIPEHLQDWNDAGEEYLPRLLGIEFTLVSGTARDGYVECVATPVHRGRTTQVWDAGIRVEGGDKTIAQFRCTQTILRP